ncbi:MAG TPA: transcription initiation factor IIB family protein [Candidatus Nitrosotalea sp.]|nr:transcription initiation factor IIB family protein [Candidatus Nitrosotalea sp.]
MSKHKQILAKQELKIIANIPVQKNEVFPGCTTRDCKGWPIITDNVSGEILCGSCGLVLEEKSLETISPHWSDPVDYLTKKSSGSINTLAMFDMNMTTIMSKRDSMGKSLSRTAKNEFYRLNILNTRSAIASKNKTLRSGLLFLNMLQMKLGIPDSIIENSAHLYRKAIRAKLTVGRKSKNIICACLYASCKQCCIPRSILEISVASNISKKEIARTYRSLVENLDLSINPFSSREFLAGIANEAKISEKSRRDALEIIYSIEKAGLSQGKNPKALASASLYLACVLNAERKTQAEIAKASRITSTTIRTRYYDLKKFFLETIDS